MRLLLVEDDRALADELQSILDASGYAVDRAADGEDALYLGRSEDYDLVVLDLGLPVLGGTRVLESWRRDGRTMPVLILTARDTWREKVIGLKTGADDYLAKPFHAEELLARLAALLRRSHGRAAPEIATAGLTLEEGPPVRGAHRRNARGAHRDRIPPVALFHAQSGKAPYEETADRACL